MTSTSGAAPTPPSDVVPPPTTRKVYDSVMKAVEALTMRAEKLAQSDDKSDRDEVQHLFEAAQEGLQVGFNLVRLQLDQAELKEKLGGWT